MRRIELAVIVGGLIGVSGGVGGCGNDETAGTVSDSASGSGGATEQSSGGAPEPTTSASATDEPPTSGASEAMTMGTTTDDPMSGSTGADTTGAAPFCGDGEVDDGEQCDAGDANGPGEACLAGCVSNVCGDGDPGPDEGCDQGADNGDMNSCKSDCTPNVCGDGFAGPGEGCDDGNQEDDDACTNACALASCGDGFLGPDEACDDANDDETDACTSKCTSAACSDGFVQEGVGEQCDLGAENSDNGACTSMCTDAVCGDGAVFNTGDGLEECDDGADNGPGKACNLKCLANVCGDGDPGPDEQCDDGNEVDSDACTQCKTAVCGDGALQIGVEECDDGNVDGGDGCSASCELEVVSLCGPGTISVLTNEGFEAGVFAPWTSNSNTTKAVNPNPHSGMWSAETNGNFYVQQDFAAVPVAKLVSANFWTWHDGADFPAMSVEWGYSDNSNGNTFYGANQLNGWQNHDILALLANGKSLVFLRVWGYTGGGPAIDITHFDDFRLCRTP